MSGQLAVQVLEFVGICRTGIARALYTRPSGQRIDRQTRVFGDRRAPAGRGVVLSLQQGVAGESGRRFLRFGNARKVVQRLYGDWKAGQDVADLSDLAVVGRGDQKGPLMNAHSAKARV